MEMTWKDFIFVIWTGVFEFGYNKWRVNANIARGVMGILMVVDWRCPKGKRRRCFYIPNSRPTDESASCTR